MQHDPGAEISNPKKSFGNLLPGPPKSPKRRPLSQRKGAERAITLGTLEVQVAVTVQTI